MKVIIRKPDLDTCLTALILGVDESDAIIPINGNASEEDMTNPHVLCIEAGGSGLVHLNNFDHHDPYDYFPPACLQAYKHKNMQDKSIERLVEYVCMVDEGVRNMPNTPRNYPPIVFPSLSNIFSGMLLLEKDRCTQFVKGLNILRTVLDNNIDPFSTMPDIEQWRIYRSLKECNKRHADDVLASAVYYESKTGIKVGFVQSIFIGGIGAMYKRGCEVVIMFNPAFGEPPVRKYTIAGNGRKVSHLIEYFSETEIGWGGRETIIGSPCGGTILQESKVLETVLEHL